jgi:hypothetical protein
MKNSEVLEFLTEKEIDLLKVALFYLEDNVYDMSTIHDMNMERGEVTTLINKIFRNYEDGWVEYI